MALHLSPCKHHFIKENEIKNKDFLFLKMERVKEKENEGIIGPTRKPQQNPTFVIGTQDLYPHCFTMAAVAARSCLRSATTSARSAASRFSAGAKPKAASSPFRTSSQSPITARIFRLFRQNSLNISMWITFSPFIYFSIYVCVLGHQWSWEALAQYRCYRTTLQLPLHCSLPCYLLLLAATLGLSKVY